MKIDLRSDTVTKPTKGMLDAMFSAAVGDDVFGEDPTVIQLEEKTAKMFGKEAGIFCPSGTMTNQIAIKLHTSPGDEIVCDTTAHVYNYEGGGIGFNSGCSIRLIQGVAGQFSATDVLENINPDNVHHPVTKLVVIENTSNKGGGSIWKMAELTKISSVCIEQNLGLHLDGARIFNATSATGQTPAQHGQMYNSISVCLSKGLGAPVGSVLLGSGNFILKARRIRKVFGGGMRQAGYLAAAGIYALDNNILRLNEDHKRAAQLAEMVARLEFVDQVLPVETNIVIFKLNPSMPLNTFINQLNEKNVFVVPFGNQTIRMVTHLDFDDNQLEMVSSVIKSIR